MRRLSGAFGAALLSTLLATGAIAQELDAYVLPAGVFRISAGGGFDRFHEIFGPSGKVPLGGNLSGPLLPSTFSALQPLQTNLSAFLTATAHIPGATAFTLDPKTLTLGTASVALNQTVNRAPLGLEVGIGKRLQIGASVPFVQGEQLVERLSVVNALVGVNPAPSANALVLARLAESGTALGNSALLPTDGSPAGQELQRRVRASTGGDSLILPKPFKSDSSSSLAFQTLLAQQTGVDSLRSGYGLWHLGDVEVNARVTLIDELRGAPLAPDSGGRRLRLALTAGLRLPTGQNTDTLRLFPREPEQGLIGFQGGAVGDVFLGRHAWITVGVRETLLTQVQTLRRVATFDAPLAILAAPRTVRWNPADTLELRVTPRYRIAGLISVGADYRSGWVSASRFTGGDAASSPGADVLDTEAGLMQRAGLGIRFLSLPAFIAGHTGIPVDLSVSYSRTLTAPEGSPVTSSVEMFGRLYGKLWGRGLRGR